MMKKHRHFWVHCPFKETALVLFYHSKAVTLAIPDPSVFSRFSPSLSEHLSSLF